MGGGGTRRARKCPRQCERRWQAAERSARERAEADSRPRPTLRKRPRAVHAPIWLDIQAPWRAPPRWAT
jgi:hypothetical protein